MSDLVERLNEILTRIEQSPKRSRGGAGGQTIEATLASQLVQVSMLDVETVYEARDTLEALQAERDAWRRVAQSATPGGSEFCTPAEVGEYIQDLKRRLIEAKKDAARARAALGETT